MNELRRNLRKDFLDPAFRHIYAEESLNTFVATQIKVLREQQKLTQTELAEATGMAQPRIAVLEDINYSNWSINTLKRIARGLDLRLSVRFESFSSLIPELEGFTRESLERPSFKDDEWFHKEDAAVHASALNVLGGSAQGFIPDIPAMSAKVLYMPDLQARAASAAIASGQ